MRAIVYRGAGGIEIIDREDRPDPTAGPERVVVEVAAAGLNRADVIQRRGGYPAPSGWPADIPGLEYAGRIVAVGANVGQWKVGDRVMGLLGGGAHAERVAAHHRELIAIPAHLTDEEAAAVPEAFLTAYDALVIRARTQPGERVLVHAVGSGVSTAAVQLAKWLGATVIGTSRTAAKLELARRLGLDAGIHTGRDGEGGETGFRRQVGAPVDVILDSLGGPAFVENLGALAVRGRLVLLGTLQGSEAPLVNVGLILRSRLEIVGTVMRTRPHQDRVALIDEFVSRVLPELRPDGPLRPVVGEVFPMAEVREAHRAMEANRVYGKIVLRW
jgi:putative PIG3 family NAD(P)H quinone oxidoreductase